MKKAFLLILLTAGLLSGVSMAASDAANNAREAARRYGAAVRNCDMGWAVDSMYPPLRRTYADQLTASAPGSEAARAHRIMGINNRSETKEEARARMIASDRALREKYARLGKAMKDSGVKIESFTVGAPYSEYVVTPPMASVQAVRKDTKGVRAVEEVQQTKDRSRIVVLPTTLVISMPSRNGTTRMERRSHIFAVRDEVITDTGISRGTKLNQWYFIDGNTDVNTLRTFFPDLPLYIKLPASGDRTL